MSNKRVAFDWETMARLLGILAAPILVAAIAITAGLIVMYWNGIVYFLALSIFDFNLPFQEGLAVLASILIAVADAIVGVALILIPHTSLQEILHILQFETRNIKEQAEEDRMLMISLLHNGN